MARGVTRARLIRLGAAAAAGLAFPLDALARLAAPNATSFAVRGSGRPYRGDRRLFATVSPGVPGRDRAVISFRLDRRARVTLAAVRMGQRSSVVVWEDERTLRPGAHELVWEPGLAAAVGSHVLQLTVAANGRKRTYGRTRPASPERAAAPVVRVLGIEAAFGGRSFAPYEQMPLTILADAPSLQLTFLRCGSEEVATGRNDEMTGLELGRPATLDWHGKRSAPVTVSVQTGDWPTGVYAARLEAPDGRVGFAPFVLRPAQPGGVRQAVVVPTNTWQAYNFYDRDGDGWGDTWYAGGSPPVALDRPFLDRGVPPRFRRYDLPFLMWLTRNGFTPEFLAEDDVEALASGDVLRARYDLVVVPGHSEYVTAHVYDVLERYRDLGGRLVFLSANNVFWQVAHDGDAIRRVRLWRDQQRPEAALLGAQYRANDDGSMQAPYVVRAAERVPWLFAGTGLINGSLLGEEIGGFGIEIDQATAASPPGTIVVADIPGLFGPGLDAHMTYYELPNGARVFSAGTLDFSGASLVPPIDRMLRNLWLHMLDRDDPAAEPSA